MGSPITKNDELYTRPKMKTLMSYLKTLFDGKINMSLSMPESPTNGFKTIYMGLNTSSFKMGHIYEYQSSSENLYAFYYEFEGDEYLYYTKSAVPSVGDAIYNADGSATEYTVAEYDDGSITVDYGSYEVTASRDSTKDVQATVGEWVDISAQSFATSDQLAVKADRATTIAGYGITDAYTKAEVNTALSGKADAGSVDNKMTKGVDYVTAGKKTGTTVANYSTAEGYNTTSTGGSSHAEGQNTKATGVASHAEGFETEASGNFSHASGQGTIASGDVQAVFGKYNQEDSSGAYALIVGNGASANSRSNAFAVSYSGEVIAGGKSINPSWRTLYNITKNSSTSSSIGTIRVPESDHIKISEFWNTYRRIKVVITVGDKSNIGGNDKMRLTGRFVFEMDVVDIDTEYKTFELGFPAIGNHSTTDPAEANGVNFRYNNDTQTVPTPGGGVTEELTDYFYFSILGVYWNGIDYLNRPSENSSYDRMVNVKVFAK